MADEEDSFEAHLRSGERMAFKIRAGQQVASWCADEQEPVAAELKAAIDNKIAEIPIDGPAGSVFNGFFLRRDYEFEKRLVDYAYAIRLDLRRSDWRETALRSAAEAHPMLAEPKKKGRPKEQPTLRGLESLADPYAREMSIPVNLPDGKGRMTRGELLDLVDELKAKFAAYNNESAEGFSSKINDLQVAKDLVSEYYPHLREDEAFTKDKVRRWQRLISDCRTEAKKSQKKAQQFFGIEPRRSDP